VQIKRSGLDPYRRTSARLRAAAGDVGEVLLREGLALPWNEGVEARAVRLRHWCPYAPPGVPFEEVPGWAPGTAWQLPVLNSDWAASTHR
jgi:hypothetical protein